MASDFSVAWQSPLDDCLLWAVFKIKKVTQILWLLFSAVKKLLLILTKKWAGQTFGYFFANSSGHTDLSTSTKISFRPGLLDTKTLKNIHHRKI
jgi:hypothetical protein